MTAGMTVSEKPILFSGPMVRAILEGRKTQTRRVANVLGGRHGLHLPLSCPYGKPGDRLWVRETFCKFGGTVIFKANYENLSPISDGIGGPWRPSIHMPRWASRLTLEIAKVRVERLQEITPDDCVAEGAQYPVSKTDDPTKVKPWICISDPHLTKHLPKPTAKKPWTHEVLIRAHFAALWDSINSKRGFGWEKNPWVWVISFRRVRP